MTEDITLPRAPEAEYVDAAATAKLLRAALKRAFPGTRFSVRTERYAGGASIHVNWTDGPLVKQVEPLAKGFAGARFDGMVDAQVYASHWLMPDGSVEVATCPAMTGGQDVMTDPKPGAKLVRFGAHYVFVERNHSVALLQEVGAMVCARYGLEPSLVTVESHGDGTGYYGATLDRIPFQTSNGIGPRTLREELNRAASTCDGRP